MSGLAIDPAVSTLLVVDLQARLMPAIDAAEAVVANAQRLIDAAGILDLPVVVTEQNPAGLGPTSDAVATGGAPVVEKMTFDATQAPDFAPLLQDPARVFVVAGCEAHVCVTQTVLGLRAAGRTVYLVEDAVGSRTPANKAAAVARLRGHGAEIVTTEMVIFEWARTATHPRFKELLALVK